MKNRWKRIEEREQTRREVNKNMDRVMLYQVFFLNAHCCIQPQKNFFTFLNRRTGSYVIIFFNIYKFWFVLTISFTFFNLLFGVPERINFLIVTLLIQMNNIWYHDYKGSDHNYYCVEVFFVFLWCKWPMCLMGAWWFVGHVKLWPR